MKISGAKCFLSFAILIIFLFSVGIASAGTGEDNVKVIKVVDGKKVDITKDNKEKGDKKSTGGTNKEEETQKEDTATESKVTDMEAGQAMIENAGINIGYRIGDEFLKGGFKFSSVDVENRKVTDDKTLTYSLYSKEMNPFKEESVRRSIIITYLIHVVFAISITLLGVCRYVAQVVDPKRTTKFMAGFSGEYVQFDIVCFIILGVGVLVMPIFDVLGISYSLLNRNVIAGLMTAKTLDIVGATTESLPTYILVNAAWYFNNLEKLFGEYAINTMVKLVIVKTWVQAVIVLFGSLTKAAFVQAGVMIGFILVLLMDIITLFFVSSGIDYMANGSWGHALIGMVVAAIIDFLIIAGMFAFPVLLLYSRIRSGRFGGKA